MNTTYPNAQQNVELLIIFLSNIQLPFSNVQLAMAPEGTEFFLCLSLLNVSSFTLNFPILLFKCVKFLLRELACRS